MRHTWLIKLLAGFLLAVACFGQGYIQTPPPHWYVVGVGNLASRPATCTQDFHIYICNGTGCTTNGEYHYCSAPNTWTVASPVPGAPGADGAPGVPGYSPNNLLSGGYVVWLANFDFRVSAATYYIGGTQYSSPQTDVTLGAAGGQPRFDAIVVDDTGSVVVIPGTPSATPEKPTVDPSTQLDLTFVLVPAGSTQPPDVTSTLVYNEDTGGPGEWVAAVVGGGFNAASTNNPFVGTKDVEATAVATGNYVEFTAAAPLDLGTLSNLVFYIRSKAAWPSNNKRNLQLAFSTAAGVQVGSIVTMTNGQFGWTSSQTTAYQQIVVPLSLFTLTAPVSKLRVTVGGSGTTLGFYLDYISFQAGIQPPTNPSGMTWKGTWNATTTYAVNDVVIYGGGSYVALVANTNSVPPSANWAAMLSSTTLLRGFGASFDGGGSALAAGKTVYTTIPYGCTIQAWNIMVDTGTATVDIWRVGTGTAIPVVGDKITGVGVGRPAIAANTAIRSTNFTGWSSTVIVAHDILGFNLQAVATATFLNFLVECQ